MYTPRKHVRRRATIPHRPIALWRGARAFLEKLWSLFGAPVDIARQNLLTAETHALIASWLRAGEAIMRRLLVIEAAALPRSNAPPPQSKPRHGAQRGAARINLDAPETWRAGFRCLLGPPAPSPAQRQHNRKSARPFRPALPIALRMEALLRVFNDPEPFVRRLARRLARTPLRVFEMMREPTPTLRAAPRLCAAIEGLGPAAWDAYASIVLRDTS